MSHLALKSLTIPNVNFILTACSEFLPAFAKHPADALKDEYTMERLKNKEKNPY